MTKKPNPQRRCVFCDGTPVSKEHIFPAWMRNYIPEKTFQAHHYQYAYSADNFTGQPKRVEQKGKLERPGDRRSRTLRVACIPCNSGWMSKMQNNAKPLLLPFIRGEWPPLTMHEQQIIASWAAMTTMVREYSSFEGGKTNVLAPKTTAIPQTDRTFLRNYEIPPPRNWFVAMGAWGPIPANCLMGYRWVDLQHPLVNPADAAPDFQTTVFAAGRVFFHTFSSTNEAFFQQSMWGFREFSVKMGHQSIWPTNSTKTSPINKPPDATFEPEDFIQNFLSYIADNAYRFIER